MHAAVKVFMEEDFFSSNQVHFDPSAVSKCPWFKSADTKVVVRTARITAV